MKTILLLFLFFLTFNSFAQDKLGEQGSTVLLKSLPKLFQEKVNKKILKLHKRGNLKGKFTKRDEFSKYTYYFELTKKDSLIFGEYKRIQKCDNCDLNNFGLNEYKFKVKFVYCCKDDKHSPNETAHTEKEMKEIQKRNSCSKRGICIVN